MKVADVVYDGPMRHQQRRVPPTGSEYVMKRGTSVALDSVEEAEYFDSIGDPYVVNWTVHGRLLREVDGELSRVSEAISELGYRSKQQLAKSFGIKANQSEEELEEALEEYADGIQREAEK